MRFAPKTEKEISEMNLWPEGVYDFEVTAASNTLSKASNEMIALTLRFFDDQGGNMTIFEYLLEAMVQKLRNAADGMGLLDKYTTGALDANDFLGKTGRAKLVIQKDKAGQYPDKNVVRSYVSKSEAPVQISKDLDDSIPF